MSKKIGRYEKEFKEQGVKLYKSKVGKLDIILNKFVYIILLI